MKKLFGWHHQAPLLGTIFFPRILFFSKTFHIMDIKSIVSVLFMKISQDLRGNVNIPNDIISSWDFPVILRWSCISPLWSGKTQGLHWYAPDVGFSIISDSKEQSEWRLWLDENSSARLQPWLPWHHSPLLPTPCFQVWYIVIYSYRPGIRLCVLPRPENTIQHDNVFQLSWCDRWL